MIDNHVTNRYPEERGRSKYYNPAGGCARGPTVRKSMRISRVSLRNYRAYESLDLDLNPGMNVIVGENNVGKSSLMQAVQLVMSLPTGNQLSRDYWPDGSPKGPLSILVELVLTGSELEKISAGLPNHQRSALRD